MAELTDEMKKEIYSQFGEGVAATIPTAFEKMFKGDGEGDDTVSIFTDEAGEQYAVPATLAAILAKAKGAGAAVGTAASKVAGAVRKHPGRAAAGAAGAGGFLAGRATKRKYALQGYQINDETGEIYLDGEAVGMVLTYEDMQAIGLDVPTVVKRPEELPKVGPTADPQLEISEDDVGIDSRNVAATETDPGAIAGDIVQPLDRAESEQFAEEVSAELYNLRQEVTQLKTANSLISEGRRAEEYTKWLNEQRQAGVPIGDIEKAAEFMMSQSPEQVDAYKKLLLTQPKVAFGKAEETLQFGARGNTETEEAVKQDYAQNKETYRALGVTDVDMKYAKYVRTNQAVGEVQPQ